MTKTTYPFDDIYKLINRRRRQLLVHSVIYYRYCKNIISDAQWTKWAFELVDLQEKYPEIAKKVPYANEFEGFDGSTGYDLPLYDEWAVSKALYLMKIYNL